MMPSPSRYQPVFIKGRYRKYIVNGSVGSGKSGFLEFGLEYLLKLGCLVFDLWAAGNFENCFWCVPGKADPSRKDDPKARSIGYPILIVHPRTTRVEPQDPVCTCGKWENEHDGTILCKRYLPLIRTVYDDEPLENMVNLVLGERRKLHRVIVFNEAFYEDTRDALRVLARLLREYPRIIRQEKIPYDLSCVIGLRELGDLVTGGVKAVAGPYQTETRRVIQTLIRKNRHWHTHIVGDSQRNEDIAAAVADQKDFLVIKQSTYDLIPQKYNWVIDLINEKRSWHYENYDFDGLARWPALNKLRKNQCYIVHPDNSVELRTHPLPGFKHKEEHDRWKVLANVVVDVGAGVDDRAAIRVQRAVEQHEQSEQQRKALKDAYQLRQEGKSFVEAASAVAWLGKNGKPSGDALRMAINRAIERGDLP